MILLLLVGLTYLTGSFPKEKYVDPTGTYELDSETRIEGEDTYGYRGQIQIKRLSEKLVVMTFYVNKGAPSYNSGSFVDTLDYHINKAIYFADPELDPTCKITFDFTDNGVNVTEETENNFGCGFGYGVVADGFFKKVSCIQPVLRHPLTDEKLEQE